MQTVIDNCSARMKKSVEALSQEYASLRTGRASAQLFDKIKVDYYGAETPLSQVASISVPEARLVGNPTMGQECAASYREGNTEVKART